MYQEPDTLLWYVGKPGERGGHRFAFVTQWGDQWAAHVGRAVNSGDRVIVCETELLAAGEIAAAIDTNINRIAGLARWNAGLYRAGGAE